MPDPLFFFFPPTHLFKKIRFHRSSLKRRLFFFPPTSVGVSIRRLDVCNENNWEKKKTDTENTRTHRFRFLTF
jgi:hypothetical protein